MLPRHVYSIFQFPKNLRMTDDLKIFILSMTCAVPATLAFSVQGKIHRVFKPVAYIFLLAVITESTIYLSKTYPLISGNLITNIFLLLNTSLQVLFFYQLKIIRNKQTAILILAFFVVVLIGNAVYLHSLNDFCSIAALVMCILILLMAVEGITIQTFRSKEKWSSDFVFLFCIITVIYNANVVFYFSIALIGVKDGDLHGKVLGIYRFINAACNILYVWPILCIPRNNSYMKLF